jgi:ABC-2 type transport system ATP-binding protein
MISAAGLCRSYGRVEALRDLSLDVAAGEIYGLVGPDGAGKTTALRLIVGSIKPGEGSVSVAGHDMARQPEQARARIGYLSQRFSLYEDLTVLENIRFFAEARGMPAGEWRPRCQDILDFVGLAEFAARRAGALSGGMKQKLGLATALVHRPAVLLLDEPTTGVDPVTRQDFWQLIIRLAAEDGVAVLVTTPYMDEASRCTRVGFLRQGRLLAQGTPAELRARLDGRVWEVRGRPLSRARRLAEQDEAVEAAQLFGDRLHVLVREGAADVVMAGLALRLAAEGGALEQARPIAPHLEDVFIALSGGAA